MAMTAFSVIIFTIIWGVVGIILPFLVPQGPNKGIIQCILMLTATCCWLLWLCCYLVQMNLLIEQPVATLNHDSLLNIASELGNHE